MSIYASAPVDEVPNVFLSNWSIREDNQGRRYFVGFDEIERDGRVSTSIVGFDIERRIGLTTSGRRYVLIDRCGGHGDSDYVWGLVVRVRGLSPWRDVTAEIVPNWRIPLRVSVGRIDGAMSVADVDRLVDLLPSEGDTAVMPLDGHISTLPVYWRARAYGRGADEEVKSFRLLSSVAGECELKAAIRRQMTKSEMYLRAAAMSLRAQRHPGGRIDPLAAVPHQLKIWVTALQNLEDRVGIPIARFDLSCGVTVAEATLYSTDWSARNVGRFSLSRTDGIWEIFVRALALQVRSRT